MSKVQLQGNVSGTGVFTIASPNSNTDRTLTLPDAAGTIQVSGNPISGTTGTFTGLLNISAAGAGQIQFPATQNASGNANTLDDYEEGTYSISMTSTSGSITTASSENTGYYVKVGRMVLATGRVLAQSVSSPSGELQINLPFTSASVTQQSTAIAASIFVWNATSSASTNGLWTLFSDPNQSFVYARYGNSVTPGSSAQFVQALTEIRFTVTYVATS